MSAGRGNFSGALVLSEQMSWQEDGSIGLKGVSSKLILCKNNVLKNFYEKI